VLGTITELLDRPALNSAVDTNPSKTNVDLRPAAPSDVDGIARIWLEGWSDGHSGHVPDVLYRHRRPDDFLRLARERVDSTTVAAIGSQIVGFVTVIDDEIEQIYVDRSARSGEVAAALLRTGEELIAKRFDRAWLAVVAGNERARRFYARNGWEDSGLFDYSAEVADGRVSVPCHKYQKEVVRR
jgi:ribosomal protein S18 acetylase RimI-like enzyme